MFSKVLLPQFCFFFFLFSGAVSQPVREKVILSLYAESLCPDCIHFTKGPLSEAFEKVPEIFTLDYVPWGNAKLESDGQFDCQHGEMECTMNTYDACVLKYYPSNSQFWPYLKCSVGYGEMLDPSSGNVCATKAGMDVTRITSCRTGPLGRSLELGYYNKTASLQPPHHYTPWVTINGQHSPEAEEGFELVSVICDAYQGKEKPDACMH